MIGLIINIPEQNYNFDLDVSDRNILTPSSAFGLLREGLVKNIGMDRIKGFLIRYGWEIGVSNAKEIMKSNGSLESLLKQGPIYHSQNGHISGTKYEGNVELDANQNIISVYGSGTWLDSYEAIEHVNRLGVSETQVCHTLIGYTSGYMSTVCGHKVIAKEVACVGKGDTECRWVIKTLTEWDHEMQDEYHFYSETPIIKELEYTYEQLLEQRNDITKLSNFHKRLTEEISNGSNLQSIATVVYDLIQIPIIIDDLDFHTIAYSGLSQDEFTKLRTDMQSYTQANFSNDRLKKKEKYQLAFRKKIIKTAMQERLITPIIMQKKVIGYCSFIYHGKENRDSKDDIMLLERIANAASLILLNEKTSLESLERMKGSFLEQIVNNFYSSNQEIINRGKYISLELDLPFNMAVLDYENKQGQNENEWLFHEQILEMTFQYFKKQRNHVLIGQRDGKIILLVTRESTNKTTISDVLKKFIIFLETAYPKCSFKIGFSNEGEKIENAVQYYEEATVALRLTTKKKVVGFESLGIVGVLINSQNISGIKMIAKQELGLLYDLGDEKKVALIKTLYVFLLNGGNIKQTMNELSLSKSGLMYRIKKIETIMEKDLRNPKNSYQLLLILDSLIALGELPVE
ncbi:XylR N-terminal domain-containing protein [Peribacillus simplex]|uniref:XylR N-terminal domain-containing protein n=1 Tax=Peribacillus simplex TaxID=1478 RepID=UPI00380515C2